MTKITFIEYSGAAHTVEAQAGLSVMQAAVNNLVPGIEADCGGMCACATCHGYIDADWRDKLPPRNLAESEMLENAANVRDDSRLTCQIRVGPELDGLVVRLPESQY